MKQPLTRQFALFTALGAAVLCALALAGGGMLAQKPADPAKPENKPDAARPADTKPADGAKPADTKTGDQDPRKDVPTPLWIPIHWVTVPQFNDAPVTDVLNWASREFGIAFLSTDGRLNGADGKPLRLTWRQGNFAATGLPPWTGEGAPPKPGMENGVLALYAMLREAGLVAMPLAGMAQPTCQVMSVKDASAYGRVTTSIDDLEGTFFGTLALHAEKISVRALRDIVTRSASPTAVISVFEPTSRVLVADYIDQLRVVAAAADEAQTPALRDDDIITSVERPTRHDPRGLMNTIMGAKHATQEYQVALNESSHALVFTGRRKDVDAALFQFDAIEKLPALAEEQPEMNIYSVRTLGAAEVAQSLRGQFAAEVSRGQVRITEIVPRGQVVVSAPQKLWKLMNAALPEIDRVPHNAEEQAADERYKAMKALERRNAADAAKADAAKPDPAKPAPPNPDPSKPSTPEKPAENPADPAKSADPAR
jgi:hypothetical protein